MRFTSILSAVMVCVSADAADFTIDPAQSSVTLSGSVSSFPLTEQGPGSLTTKIEGTMQVDPSNGQITIWSGTLDAKTNGVWQPGPGGTGNATVADFGAKANTGFFGTIFGALRNIVMSVFGASQPVQNTQFDASGIVFSFPTGSTSALDYSNSASFIQPGTKVLEGASTNRTATVGTITGAAGSQVLTIAIDTTFRFSVLAENDTELTVRGQIVAREGGVTPDPTRPTISKIEFANNQMKLTVDGTTATAKIQSSTNLTSWADKQAQVTVVDPDTRLFTIATSGPKEFYQVLQ